MEGWVNKAFTFVLYHKDLLKYLQSSAPLEA